MPNVITYLRTERAAGSPTVKKIYKITVSGSYVNGGAVGVPGETLNFNAALNPGYKARTKLPSAPAGRLPVSADFDLMRAPEGFTMQFEPNSVSPTPANVAGRIFAAGSGGTTPVEIASGAYLAALAADTTGFIVGVSMPAKYM